MLPVELRKALEQVHSPEHWVHLATVRKDGGPHVAPMLMGVGEDALLFSLTGMQKKRNLRRDTRCCVSVSQPGTLAHVIVWGSMEVRDDPEAQPIWDDLIRSTMGEEAWQQRRRELSFEGTALGLLVPERWRIYGIE